MKRFEVTFRDEIEAESEESAYDAILEFCRESAGAGDVTAFQFIEMPEQKLKPEQRKENSFRLDPETGRVGAFKGGRWIEQLCPYSPGKCSLFCPKCFVNTDPARCIKGENGVTSSFLTTCAGDFPLENKES